MINLTFVCDSGHKVKGDYKDSDTFDKLLAAAALECTYCGSTSVRRALSAPRVNRGAKVPDTAPPSWRNVGKDFTAEAMAMIKGNKPVENIVGQATGKETQRLAEALERSDVDAFLARLSTPKDLN